MQTNSVVRFVQMVFVSLPLAGTDMNLDITYPFASANAHTSMAIIRACVMVMLTHGQYFYRPTICGLLLKTRPETVFPNLLQ